MSIRRIHKKIERTPEQLAELRATRAAFQAEKPGPDDPDIDRCLDAVAETLGLTPEEMAEVGRLLRRIDARSRSEVRRVATIVHGRRRDDEQETLR